MRRWLCLWVLMSVSSVALAQEPPQGDELRRKYDETLVQLKAAQDRKNELSTENDKLNARLAEMQKQIDSLKTENQMLRREVSEASNKTFLLRSHFAAWERFVEKYPAIQSRWKVFSQLDLFSAPEWLVREAD